MAACGNAHFAVAAVINLLGTSENRRERAKFAPRSGPFTFTPCKAPIYENAPEVRNLTAQQVSIDPAVKECECLAFVHSQTATTGFTVFNCRIKRSFLF
jgi:hypothetical protein